MCRFLNFNRVAFLLLFLTYAYNAQSQKAVNWFDSGFYQLKNNQYKKAIHCFTMDIRNKSTNTSYSFYNRAQSYYFLNKRDSAVSDLKSSLNIKYYNPDVHYLLGKIAFDKQDSKTARQYFNQCLNINSQHFLSRYYRAETSLIQMQYDSAFSDLNICLGMDPNHIESLMTRAKLHTQFEQYADATFDYNHLLSIDFKNSEALINRSRLFLNKRNTEYAFRDLEFARTLDSTNYKVYTMLAEAFLMVNEPHIALEKLAISKRLGQLNTDEQCLYIECFLQLKQYSNAHKTIQLNLINNNSHLLTLQKLMRFYFETKRYEESLNESKHILKLDSNNLLAPLYLKISQYEMKLLHKTELRRFLNKGIKQNLEIWQYWYYLALLEQNEGSELACAHFKQSIEYGYYTNLEEILIFCQ